MQQASNRHKFQSAANVLFYSYFVLLFTSAILFLSWFFNIWRSSFHRLFPCSYAGQPDNEPNNNSIDSEFTYFGADFFKHV